MYDLIQSALTAAINVTAIAGITGIFAHGLWTQHKRWMNEFCPALGSTSVQAVIESETPAEETQLEQPVIEDVWEAPIATSPALYWVRPTEVSQAVLMLMPAKDEKPATRRGRKPGQKNAPKTPSKKRRVA